MLNRETEKMKNIKEVGLSINTFETTVGVSASITNFVQTVIIDIKKINIYKIFIISNSYVMHIILL